MRVVSEFGGMHKDADGRGPVIRGCENRGDSALQVGFGCFSEAVSSFAAGGLAVNG